MKALFLIIGLFILSTGYAQTATDCGNYSSVGSTTWPTTFPDPDPGCAANVPGTVLAGPTQWDGGSCTGTIVTTVTGPPVTCLTVSYEAVNQNDFATLSTDTGGALTITGTGNCGINGTVIGPYTCSGGYGSCQFTICSTIPFNALTLLNTGCSSGWVINCANVTACTAPDINPLADFIGCDSYTLPAITGSNLSGNEAYWTGSGGTGTQYIPGDVITTSMTLYIYDETTLPCMDEDTFDITLDILDPLMNCPGPLTADCSLLEQPAYATLADFLNAGGTATDETSLDANSFALINEVSDGNTCPEVVTRTYEIADDCGHTVACTQTITIHDLTPPAFIAPPANITVQCPSDVPAMLDLDWNDNCDGTGTVTGTDVSDMNTCPEIITRTWTYTDACGNNATQQQTITVHDTQAPVFNPPPANVTINCIEEMPAMTDLAYTDNCDPAGTVTGVDGALVGGGCGGTITRTWTFTDACGNVGTETQTFTIDDTTLPTASNPVGINVACASDIPAPDPIVVTDEADNCVNIPVVAWVSDVSDNNTCNNEIITRTYSVTDDCGNQILVTQEITLNAIMPSVNAGLDQSICDGEFSTLTASNPDAAVISWDNTVVDGVSFLPPLGTNTYTVTADICNGECVNTDQVNVVVNPVPVINFTGDELQGCPPHTVTFGNQSTEQYDCLWSFGDGNVSTNCGPVSHIYYGSGLFDVSLTVTSDAGCTNSDTYASYIEVVEMPDAEFSSSINFTTVADTEVDFTNLSTNATSYVWNFGDGNSTTSDENPSHTFPNDEEGAYIVTLTAYNSLGCPDTYQEQIYVEDELLFYVPNIFTPDGDQFNETFLPVFTSGFDIYDYHLTIFNRWGEIMFESFNAESGWNGHYGDGGLVEDGVYVWYIQFGETGTDKKRKVRGHVTVLK